MKKPTEIAEQFLFCGFDPDDREQVKWWLTLGPKERRDIVNMSDARLGRMRLTNGVGTELRTTIKDYDDNRPASLTEVNSKAKTP